MKVYIVTQGDYSEYHIERVFSTRDKAQEYLDHIGNNDCDIEEYNIDEETPRGVFAYRVEISDNDKPATVSLMAFTTYPNCRKDAFGIGQGMFATYTWFNIEAKDAPQAIKIASERLMQIKAMPYLFPRLKEECVCTKYLSGYVMRNMPVYNYITKEILLDDNQYLEP